MVKLPALEPADVVKSAGATDPWTAVDCGTMEAVEMAAEVVKLDCDPPEPDPVDVVKSDGAIVGAEVGAAVAEVIEGPPFATAEGIAGLTATGGAAVVKRLGGAAVVT